MTHTLVCALALAAPVPKEPPAYYPTAAGFHRVYRQNGKDDALTVTKSERSGDATLVTERWGGKGPAHRTVRVTPGELAVVVGAGGKPLDPPLVFLKVGEVGSTWTYEPAGITFTYRGAERVTVPAGTFEAVRVDQTNRAGRKSSAWFAPGVGEVKSTGDDEATRVLVSTGEQPDRAHLDQIVQVEPGVVGDQPVGDPDDELAVPAD